MPSKCVACGMPMERAEDFALHDATKDYCGHCSRPDGSMRSYEEALAGMTAWMIGTQGLDEGVAKKMAIKLMADLPAWNHELETRGQ